MTLAVLASVPDLSVRSATTRLAQEFPELRPGSIVLVVRTCREELRGSPDGALPELVERLARQRLRVLPELTPPSVTRLPRPGGCRRWATST